MATANSGVLRSIEEEINCPLCLGIFEEPKRLPCEHVFCISCLKRLLLKSTNEELICPVCRTPARLQGRDPDQFATALVVVRLVDVYRRSQNDRAVERLPGPAPDSRPVCCPDHHSQQLDLFCESCMKMVCRDCVILSCSKNNHKYGYKDAMTAAYFGELKTEVHTVVKLLENVEEVQSAVSADEKLIQNEKARHMDKIEKRFQELMDLLVQEKAFMLSAVTERFSESFCNTLAQKKELSAATDELESFILSAFKLCRDDSLSVIVKEVEKKKKEVKSLSDTFKGLFAIPVPCPQVKVELLMPEHVANLFKDNYMVEKDSAHKSYLKRHIWNSVLELKLNEPFSVTACATGIPWHSKVKAVLVSAFDGSSQSVTVTERTPDSYQLSVTPKQRGMHKLSIQCSDVHLCGSPLFAFVSAQPQKFSRDDVLQMAIPTSAMKLCENKIFVMDIGNGLTSIEFSRSSMTIGRTLFMDTKSVFAFHNDLIYLADLNDNVLKMDKNQKVLKKVGGTGSTLGKFNFPNAIRINSRGRVYVCDTRNNRIQVLDSDLKFVRSFGKFGKLPGEFKCPNDLDFDEDNNVYVADQGNNRVQVVSRKGHHIRTIGESSDAFSGLSSPVSLALHKGHVYVSDTKNQRIAVFTQSGEFTTMFGNGILTHPEYIAIDDHGYIFVTDNRCKLIRF